jgi:hypothetical protein
MTQNNSASGGYLLPQTQPSPFGTLTFEQFLQTVLVGISGLPGDLVVPRWQIDPPTYPDITVNWLSFGLSEDDSDTNAYVGVDDNGNNQFMRMEALTLQCTFYGLQSLEYGKALRDGLQIKQNLEALQKANMGFVNTSRMTRVPDLVNERWVDRWEMSVYLRREILRVYPILTFLSGSGSLIANVSSGTKTVEIAVNGQEG